MSVGEGDAGSVESPIAEWFETWRERDTVAFRLDDEAVSYRDFAARTLATAHALRRRGVQPGDRVAYCGMNRVEIFELLFASARLGTMLFPVNNRLTTAELRYQFADSEPALVIVDDGFVSARDAAVEQSTVVDLEHETLISAADREAAAHDDLGPWPHASADLLIVYTSGTTGRPKGAVLTHAALNATVVNGVEAQSLDADSRIVAPLPTFHVGGLNIQTVPTLAVGGSVTLLARFDPGAVLDAIEGDQATHTLLVPAMLDAVAAHPAFAETSLASLVGISTGSSIVAMSSMRPYFDRGVPVAQIYGATETGPSAIVMGYDEASERPESCGRRAVLTDFRIVDPVSGEDQPLDIAGEILLQGPNLLDRYWRNEAATAEAFTDGWYRTGDVGHVDADGYVWISDRLTDVVISGGENIYPAEVEAVLQMHPAFAEVTVVGRPDPDWGERCVAVAVAADSPCSLDDVRAWAGDRLARYKLPRELVWVDGLPRTALGKVQKHEVRARLGPAT